TSMPRSVARDRRVGDGDAVATRGDAPAIAVGRYAVLEGAVLRDQPALGQQTASVVAGLVVAQHAVHDDCSRARVHATAVAAAARSGLADGAAVPDRTAGQGDAFGRVHATAAGGTAAGRFGYAVFDRGVVQRHQP